MNSAPVQMLPIQNGIDFQKASGPPENIENSEGNESFQNSFNSAVDKQKSDNLEQENNSNKVSKKKESVENSNDKDEKVYDEADNEEASDAVVAERPADAENKLNEKRSEPKDGKSLKGSEHEKVLIGTQKSVKGKLSLRDGKKASKIAKGSKAGEKNYHTLKIDSKSKHKLDITSFSDVAWAKSKVGLDKQESLKTANDDKIVDFAIDKLKHDLKSEKPSVQLAAIDAINNELKGLDKSSVEKKGLKLVSNAGKTDSKLKIHDHRKLSANHSDKNDIKIRSISETSFKAAVDSIGKDVEINPADNALKNTQRSAEVKNMQSSVLSQLKDSVNNQIVKQAGIVLKGDGTGEIKLIMKPESLGKVRIQLSLDNNHIGGRIIVENNIVKEIFESNLQNLYKAFGSEGFENGGLEVSVQGEGSQSENRNQNKGRSYGGRAVQVLEDAVPEIISTEWRNNAVNMVV
ncbi:MAG: flagellar hook-length control protein FliK [Spirochaetales bacterium]|nr:flagellar hook-length control protein FliK [Spirochaetales bacterium]